MVVKKHRHKKPKFLDKSLNQKELLENILFESDESSGDEVAKPVKDLHQESLQEKVFLLFFTFLYFLLFIKIYFILSHLYQIFLKLTPKSHFCPIYIKY